ncbi:MAG: hypothetical protein QOF02_1956 [Blastocatellia bacterium]|jgi:radical SAM superfamily enzyme YgiQ (UPF0313 family)|nr:hypothetical protein [Blastocatellia bacterium]
MNTGISELNLVSIAPSRTVKKSPQAGGIMLFKPPYFTPWTPPLGISILKSFLQPHGYSVKCFDFNTDPELWGMHHKYFGIVQTLEDVSINDGYSKLWWILNAHMLAYANGASVEECARVLETIIPLYGIPRDEGVIKALLPLVERFYKQLEEAIESLDLTGYTVVGTSTYSTSLGPSLFLLRKIKEKHPHIKTVMGGGIFADDLALGSDNLETLLREYDYIDHVILGEGELLFLKLLQGELSHKRVISITDLKGTTLEMKDVPPPDFSDMKVDNYYHLTIEGARSCPFQCSFCSETIQWGDYRKKPMDLFASQVIALAEQNNINSFFMGDSLMNPYVMQFASELLERKADILYDGYLRADKPVTHRDRTGMWAKSGLYRVRLGIESASARVLDSMDKMTTPAVIADALRSLATAGIRATTYWIVGFPGETDEDFEETLDFIRENHRNIYELEAHPYYYYPYGQIGSRLYQCNSLYPDDVTDIIKFRVWDIIDVRPTRHERYERLRRISDLASKLGLPNIYNMSDRYQAEDRWLMLHPLTTQVYAGVSPHRDEASLPDEAVAVYTDDYGKLSAHETTSLDSVLCHKIAVKKKLDEKTLAGAVAQLIRYNEMLRFSLQDGQYVPADEESQQGEVLSIHQVEGEDEAAAERRIIESLLPEMRPSAGSSLRVALLNQGASCRLLVLAHKAIADSRGVVLLCEDLFRLYEQAAHGKEISLRQVAKSYTAFITERKTDEEQKTDETARLKAVEVEAVEVEAVESEAQEPVTEILLLDEKLARDIASETLPEYGALPPAVMLSALSECLKKMAASDSLKLYVKLDYRVADTALAHTMAALTRTHQMPEQFIAQAGDPRRVQETLRQLPLSGAGDEAGERAGIEAGERVLLNLEYFVNPPWLEEDEWRSEGFITDGRKLAAPYVLEIAPVMGDGLKVILKSRAGVVPQMLVEEISAHLAGELETILQRLKSYVGAKEFWLKEFGKNDGQPNIWIEGHAEVAAGESYASTDFAIEDDLTKALQDAYQASLPDVILSAYAMLLSLLNGREEVSVVASLAAGEARPVAPLRLLVPGGLSFRQFVEQTGKKSAQAAQHAAQAFEILAGEIPHGELSRARPVFDVGFVFAEAGETESAAAAVERKLESYQGAERKLALSLEAVAVADGLQLRLQSLKNLFGQESTEKLAAYLRAILEQAAANAELRLEEITLERKTEEFAAAEALAVDTFNFG